MRDYHYERPCKHLMQNIEPDIWHDQVVPECGWGGRQWGRPHGQIQTQQEERGARAEARAGESWVKLSKHWPQCGKFPFCLFLASLYLRCCSKCNINNECTNSNFPYKCSFVQIIFSFKEKILEWTKIYLSFTLTMAMDSFIHQLFFISFMISLYEVQEGNVHILNADWSIEAV